MALSRLALVSLSAAALAACNVSATQPGSTGGVGDAGTDAGDACDRGVVALLTDYMSTQISLANDQGVPRSASFLSTASSMASGDAFPLSGDVALPRSTPASGRVVLLDQSSNVVTWADPASGKVLAQLNVSTGFASDPYDYLETGATTAYLSRYDDNAAPSKQPFDEGSDVLVLDTSKPAITKSIPIPKVAGLPPRPAGLIQTSGAVILVLQPLSDDYMTSADGVLVGLKDDAIAWQVTVTGLRNCDRPTLSPSGHTLALACQGQLDGSGNVTDKSTTALALYDVSALPPKLTKTFAIADQLGATVQNGVAWISETMVLGRTQTPVGGAANNEAFTLDLTTGKASVLLTAHPGTMGGKGLVYTDVRCELGCGGVCMLADGDTGVLRRWSIGRGGLTAMSDVTVNSTTGLPPVELGGY